MSLDDLTRILRISPHLRVEPHPPSGAVFLIGERQHFIVRSVDVAAVIGAIDGTRDVDEIIAACPDVDPIRALRILRQLEAQGFVCEARAGDSTQLAFMAGLGLSHELPAVQIVDATDSAEGGALSILSDALRGAGFSIRPDGEVRVIVSADYLIPTCLDQALAAWHSRSACFLMKPFGLRTFIGPYISHEIGFPCPRCLMHALADQRPVEKWLQSDFSAVHRPPDAALPASLAAAANLGALQLRMILSNANPSAFAGRLWTLELPGLELVSHRVRRRPQCAECGDPSLMARTGERPVTLAAVPIAFSEDGGFRQESPAASYARLAHLVTDVLGPITHLHPMTDRHSDAHPVYSSGYLVVPAGRVEAVSFERRCAGKGATVEQARMSALAEAIERYSGVYRGDEASREASCAELGDEAIHPSALQLFSATQEAAGGLAPPPLSASTRIAWTPAWSLGENRRRYVPLAYCYSEASAVLGARFCRPSSNGSAAGNCLEEAILQGLFEAVERDAVAIWWYGRVRRPPIAVSQVATKRFAAQRAAREKLGWSLWALDLTHDLGLPVVVAIALHKESDRFALGFGCHSDSDLALSRAVSEVNQVLDPRGTVKSPWDGMAASKLEFLFPAASALPIPAAAPIEEPDLKVHIETWVHRLRERDLEVLVVDKTRPDLPLHVAQVIVPGLRHVWPRFAAGRLYTVPVALGWRSHPLTEEQLNPEHLLI